MSQLEKTARQIEDRENRLLDVFLQKNITETIFIKKQQELKDEKARINTERELYQTADQKFKDTIVTAFQLISQAYTLFQGSKIEQKRQFINFIFSNLKLNGNKLDFTLREPLNMLVNFKDRPGWRRERDSNPRYSITHMPS